MDAATIYHEAKKNRLPRKRHQRGSIQEKSGAFYLLYRITENGERKQVCRYLCAKDRATGCGSPSAKAVRELAEDHMRQINGSDGGAPDADLTVVKFWDDTFLKFLEEKDTNGNPINFKPSTVQGYKQVWNKNLKPHFGEMTLREYRTHHGSLFLTKLAKTYGPYTLKNIKNLCSALFTHAINTSEVIETNPWHDCKVLGKQLPKGETGHYSLEEIENIITALVGCVECQLIMALAYFFGLRRGEIQGLQWGDVATEWLHIRRNKVNGRITTLKGKKKEKDFPLIQPVKGLLSLWRAKCGTDILPLQSWVFEKNLQNTARLRIIPVLEKNKLEWKGFHAGRRGLGTIMKELTGNSTAGRDLLGHTDEKVTQEHYEAFLLQSVVAPLKMLEAKIMVTK
jgi:integrase